MKKLLTFLICGSMALTSCTEEFSPSVDYGERIYINDYQQLIDAINNLNSSLQQRLDALNQLIQSGLVDIKLSIDENTGSIEVLTTTVQGSTDSLSETVQNGINTLNTTLLNGFTALKTIIQENGEQLIYAVNQKGDLIALHLDTNGQLIEATITAQMTELIKTLKDHDAALQDKLDAISVLIETGLGTVTVDLGTLGDDLMARLSTLDDLKALLGTLNTNVTDGFTQLKTTITDSADRIVYAVNQKGDLIAVRVDENGQMLDATIKAQVQNLKETLTSGTSTLSAKLDALATITQTGLGEVKVSIGNLGSAFELALTTTNNLLTDIKGNLLSGFTTVETKLNTIDNTLTTTGAANVSAITTLSSDLASKLTDLQSEVTSQGGSIVSAVNNQGSLIIAALGTGGDLYAAIQTNTSAVNTGVQTLQQVLQENSEQLGDQMEALLNLENGVFFPERCPVHSTATKTTYEYMNITPTLFQAINADATLRNAFKNMLCEVSVTPDQLKGTTSEGLPTVSVLCSEAKSVSTGTDSYSYSWTVESKAPSALIVVGTEIRETVSDHYSLIIRNVCEWTDLSFAFRDVTYPYVYYIKGTDAKGTDRAVYGGISNTGQSFNPSVSGALSESDRTFRFYNYDTSTGVFVGADEVHARAYASKNP